MVKVHLPLLSSQATRPTQPSSGHTHRRPFHRISALRPAQFATTTTLGSARTQRNWSKNHAKVFLWVPYPINRLMLNAAPPHTHPPFLTNISFKSATGLQSRKAKWGECTPIKGGGEVYLVPAHTPRPRRFLGRHPFCRRWITVLRVHSV